MFLFYLITNPLLPVLLLGVFAAAVILAIVFGMRYRRALNGEFPDDVTIARGVDANAELFGDLYEPVYRITLGDQSARSETYAAWNERVAASDMSGECKQAFAHLFGDYADWGRRGKRIRRRKSKKIFKKKTKKLFKIITKAGVVRSGEMFENSCETTAERYLLASGDAILPGTRYFVATPCWTHGDTVVAKGVIE